MLAEAKTCVDQISLQPAFAQHKAQHKRATNETLDTWFTPNLGLRPPKSSPHIIHAKSRITLCNFIVAILLFLSAYLIYLLKKN